MFYVDEGEGVLLSLHTFVPAGVGHRRGGARVRGNKESRECPDLGPGPTEDTGHDERSSVSDHRVADFSRTPSI